MCTVCTLLVSCCISVASRFFSQDSRRPATAATTKKAKTKEHNRQVPAQAKCAELTEEIVGNRFTSGTIPFYTSAILTHFWHGYISWLSAWQQSPTPGLTDADRDVSRRDKSVLVPCPAHSLSLSLSVALCKAPKSCTGTSSRIQATGQ